MRRLCSNHQKGLGWDECSEGFVGCEFEDAREEEVSEEMYFDGKYRAVGPFEARSASVFDEITGTYIIYCAHDHNSFLLDAEHNAQLVADALNEYKNNHPEKFK